MTSPVDIRPDHLAIVQDILREHLPGGVKVWVFGSRASWTTKDSSDLDLALECESKLSHKVLGALEDAFEDSALPYTVDVVDLNRIGDSFRQIVESQRTPLFLDRVVTYGAPLTAASGEWGKATLGDVCTKIGSGATPRGGRDVYLESGPYSLIRSQNVYNDGFRRDGLAFIGEHHADALENVEVFEGDVLLNITGDSVARTCQVPSDALPARVNQHVAIVRPDSAVLDAEYLRYCLVSAEMQTLLLSWAGSGGTRNALTKSMIESVEVLFPPLPEQRAIAHILGTLDDKIELNRRMNETLEAITQTLFKSWFVDFEPVRAKMEGRWHPGESLPGLPAEHYELFPDRLVDSELGEIPEGWEVKELGELMDYREGPGIRNWQYTNSKEGTRFINIRCIQDGDIQLTTANRITDEEANGKYAHFHLKEWDVVVSTSGTLGRSAVVRAAHLPLVLNTSVIRFRPAEGASLFSYVYGYLNSRVFLDELEMSASGSVQKNFGPMHLKKMQMLCPPYNCIEVHEQIAGILLQKLIAKRAENDALVTHRDALLPRLMGEALAILDGQVIGTVK